MAAIELGVVGQTPQFEQRLPHHFRVAFDDAAAADGEQRVADKGEFFCREEIRDVAGGVARRLDHPPGERAHFYCVAVANGFIDQRDALRFIARCDHPALVRFLQLRDAAGVIAMMVRHQDVGQAPAGPLERRFDRRRLGRIDRGGRAACGIMDEHAEIVGEAAEEVCLYGHFDIVVVGAGVAAVRNP